MVGAQVLLLDVNETLTDMSGLDPVLAEVLPEGSRAAAGVLRQLWFARVLRDGFALTAAGREPSFAALARTQAEHLLSAQGVDDPAGGAERLVAGVAELRLHPDVAAGLRRLAAAGYRLVPFTNGSVDVAVGAFERDSVLELFETRLSVVDAGVWKPAGDAYRWAAGRLGVPVEACALLAVHPWDLMGAAEAGLGTAWVFRGTSWPDYLEAPGVEAPDVEALADLLVP